MELIAQIRTLIISYYKRYEAPVNYLLKFIMGFIIFSSINGFFSSLGVPYSTALNNFAAVLFAALLTAVIPITWVFMLAWLFICVHIFSFSLELAVFTALILLCLMLFYIRVFPKESYLIILLLVCFKFNIPYAVPLIAGLFFGLGALGALIAGTLVWHCAVNMEKLAVAGTVIDDVNVLELPSTLADNYKMAAELLSDGYWIYIALAFVVTAIVVHIVSKMPFDYSMEASVALGAVVLVITMLIGIVAGDIPFNGFFMILSVIISSMITLVCNFMYVILDYPSVERVSFQDDDYVYYVKAVPKIVINAEEE
jgi:hypothetical protein